ncbi:MAG: MBL fold metallo-hydrolase [Firmicutes bacterium]|jgi:glyoxylase-like metal-dependent hydrolase (beta-lactamase superfamily II)|nr:MBL fold metallo-hydrolase [Bacillota bacterium]
MSVFFKQLRAGIDFATDDRLAKSMANYAYIIGDTAAREALLIDPAYSPEELVRKVEQAGFQLKGVVVTHFHADHAGGTLYSDSSLPIPGIRELLELSAVPIHVQKAESEWLEKTTGVGKDDLCLHESGDQILLGDTRLSLIHTPGHTPGSQCVLIDNTVLTGDTLFLRGCGRTDLPGGDAAQLYNSLRELVSTLPVDTIVCTGHDYEKDPYQPLSSLLKTNPVLWDIPQESWIRKFGS